MSDYDFRPGGSLKLKGGVIDGRVTKKKKKTEKLKSNLEKLRERERVEEALMKEDETKEAGTPSGSRSGTNTPADDGNSGNKTEAERRFEQIQRRRMAERVSKMASKTHKDRVHDFNTKLEALSEHHDIPKVGPG